jgi:predicted NAD/FAD-binding protein
VGGARCPSEAHSILRRMSDVIWAALVAVVGSGITGLIAYKAASRQADVAITTAEQRATVELAKVTADNDRLRREHLEADRQVRRDAYQRLLVAIEQFDVLTSAYTPAPDRAALDAWLATFRAAGVSVRLVESESVREARRAVDAVMDRLAPEVQARTDAGESMEDALGIPYVAAQPQFAAAGKALGDAMRADLAYAPDVAA